MCVCPSPGGGVLPYLGMVGRFSIPIWILILYLTQSDCPLFLQKKIGLSLSDLDPGILGPKFCLTFHQKVLLNRFYAFCINCP